MKPSARPMITRDDMRGDPVDQLHPLIRACEQVGDGCLRVGLHRIGLRERGLRAGVDVVGEAGFLRPPKANEPSDLNTSSEQAVNPAGQGALGRQRSRNWSGVSGFTPATVTLTLSWPTNVMSFENSVE